MIRSVLKCGAVLDTELVIHAPIEQVVPIIDAPAQAIRPLMEQLARRAISRQHDVQNENDGVTEVDEKALHMTANMDPGRDLVWNGHRLGIDATSKSEAHERNGQPVRKWPPPIAMDPEIVEFARQFVSGSTQEA